MCRRNSSVMIFSVRKLRTKSLFLADFLGLKTWKSTFQEGRIIYEMSSLEFIFTKIQLIISISLFGLFQQLENIQSKETGKDGWAIWIHQQFSARWSQIQSAPLSSTIIRRALSTTLKVFWRCKTRSRSSFWLQKALSTTQIRFCSHQATLESSPRRSLKWLSSSCTWFLCSDSRILSNIFLKQ